MRTAGLFLVAVLTLAGCTTVGDGVPGDGDGDGDGEGDDVGQPPPIDAMVCDEVVPIEVSLPEPPDLLLVVDKSGSMSESLDGVQDKWTVMRAALQQIVGQNDVAVHFGLFLYPADSLCAAGTVRTPIAAGSGPAIGDALTATFPDGGTPTHTTLGAALSYYQSIPVNPDGRFVLLATDGQPNCASASDPWTPTVTQSVAQVQSLLSAGIRTFVLGFGSTVVADPAALQAMAEAGGTVNYYPATSPAQLQAALDAILGEVIVPPCTLALEEVPPDPTRIAVYLDGVPVPRDPAHVDGWDYDPATNTITLYGTACTQLQSGSVNSLRVDRGCPGPVVE